MPGQDARPVLVAALLFALALPATAGARVFEYLGAIGSSGANDGQFTEPRGVAIGPTGTIYVTDAGRNRITYFNYTGGLLGGFGSSGSGNGQFSSPSGITVDRSANQVYVADTGNNRVQKFGATGGYVTQWGGAGSGDGQFNGLAGIDTDSSWLYTAENGNSRAQKFSLTGTYVRKWNAAGATFLATDANVVIIGGTDVTGWSVFGDVPADGAVLFGSESARVGGLAADGRSSSFWHLSRPQVGPLANTWVLRRFSPIGAVSELYPLRGDAAPSSSDPNVAGGIATDCRGTVFVVDRNGDRILRFGDPAAPPPPCSSPSSSLSTSSISFGQQAATTISPGSAVDLQAAGDGIDVSSVRLTGANADDFLIASDGCSGRTAWPGTPCTVRVRYAPSAPGASSATLAITDATTFATRTATLTGTATAAPAVGSGPQGPAGPSGKDGSDGKSAPAATAACVLSKTGKVSCAVRPKTQRVSITLLRRGKTYARGSGKGTVKLKLLRKLGKGTYSVRIATTTTSSGTALVIRK